MGAIRDAWLILGITLVILVGLEAASRGQASLRRALRGEDAAAHRPDHPYASEAWWAEWTAGAGRSSTRYDPYRAIWSLPRTDPI